MSEIQLSSFAKESYLFRDEIQDSVSAGDKVPGASVRNVRASSETRTPSVQLREGAGARDTPTDCCERASDWGQSGSERGVRAAAAPTRHWAAAAERALEVTHACPKIHAAPSYSVFRRLARSDRICQSAAPRHPPWHQFRKSANNRIKKIILVVWNSIIIIAIQLP
jgi:hypothetical protein